MRRPKVGYSLIHRDRKVGEAGPQTARWDGKEARCPKAGEFFLSGAPGFERAYLARNNLTTPYFIAVPL